MCIVSCVELYLRFLVYFRHFFGEVREFNVFRKVTFTPEYFFITRFCGMFVFRLITIILSTSAI